MGDAGELSYTSDAHGQGVSWAARAGESLCFKISKQLVDPGNFRVCVETLEDSSGVLQMRTREVTLTQFGIGVGKHDPCHCHARDKAGLLPQVERLE